jgi:hypothetical protein
MVRAVNGRRIPQSHAVSTRSWATTRGEERLAAEDAARREWLDARCGRAPNGGRSAPTLCAVCGRELGLHSARNRRACRRPAMVALELVVDDAAVARERGR